MGLWLRKNLFNTWYNVILTLAGLFLSLWGGLSFLDWAINRAKWAVVTENIGLFVVGRYPEQSIWRIWLILTIIAALSLFSWQLNRGRFPNCPAFLQRWWGLLWLLTLPLIAWLLLGGLFLTTIPLDDLSGLILTLLVAIASMILSFPLGVLLALGRQSELPAIRWLSIGYIELLRGLPLLGILFMAQVMLPLILPAGTRPERVIRAIAGFTLFAAAYLAENVRGGLQAIPKGQIEAARALGLKPIFVLLLIVLPQALKAVIPAIVGQFISLFKDTSLLAIVGLVDLLGMAGSVLANPKFIGDYPEVYLFLAFIYWIFCYSMSLASRRLEQR